MFLKRLLEILFLACLWAPSFLFTKIAIQEIDPITVVALRVGLGGLLLLLFIKIKGIKFPNNPKFWIHGTVLGFLVNGFPFVCYSYSVHYIPTSLSALINGTVPILTVILANLFLEDEKMTWYRGFGVLLGFIGFLIVFLPSLFENQAGFQGEGLGILLASLGSCSYAIGMVYARKFVKGAPPLIIPAIQVLSSVIYLAPVALIFEWPQNVLGASLPVLGAICGLAIMGTALAFIMYHRIVTQYGATSLSMVTYLLPVLATILGVLFLNESIGLRFWVATALILAGILVVNMRRAPRVVAESN